MPEPLLTLAGVHTHIGQYHILQGVDFGVPDGDLTVLLGRNGAGKTTTLRTIMGLWKPSRGQVTFAGRTIGGLPAHAIARAGIAYVPESMAVFSDLTVEENMLLAARDGPLERARLNWVFSFFPALQRFWTHPAGTLSGGQKQMLSIARAVIEPRRLILIDEPSKGIAPAIIENMIRAFRELKRERTTVLLVEQNFRFAEAVGDWAVVMDDGRIVHRASMAELARDGASQRRLLGLSLEAQA
jgi:branched-chain amino acid transport system ATP-binding protein